MPQTVTRPFRDRSRRALEDYIGAIVEAMRIFRSNREIGYRAIAEASRVTKIGLEMMSPIHREIRRGLPQLLE